MTQDQIERRETVHRQFQEAQQKQFAGVKRNVARLRTICTAGFLLNLGVALYGAVHGDRVQTAGAWLVLCLSFLGYVMCNAWLETNRDRIS